MRSLYVFMIACILPAISGNAKADMPRHRIGDGDRAATHRGNKFRIGTVNVRS